MKNVELIFLLLTHFDLYIQFIQRKTFERIIKGNKYWTGLINYFSGLNDDLCLTQCWRTNISLCPQCGMGSRCAMKFGPRIGKLCDCGRGANCNSYLLKCIWGTSPPHPGTCAGLNILQLRGRVSQLLSVSGVVYLALCAAVGVVLAVAARGQACVFYFWQWPKACKCFLSNKPMCQHEAAFVFLSYLPHKTCFFVISFSSRFWLGFNMRRTSEACVNLNNFKQLKRWFVQCG